MSKAKISEKKYINTVLFLCHRLGGSITGKKKLYKLLYYVDFDKYEYKESMQSVTGDTYIAWKMGPVPSSRDGLLNFMILNGLLSEDEEYVSGDLRRAVKYTALVEPDMSVFNEDERYILERVIEKYGGLTGKQLEVLTHAEAPYIATEQNEVIDYGLAFYRETVFDDNLVTA